MSRRLSCWIAVMLAGSSSAACVDRNIPAEQFGCGRGGACPDGGLDAGPGDGGRADAGRDAGSLDAEPDPESCPDAWPITVVGRASGTFAGQPSDVALSCWDEIDDDMLFRLQLPNLKILELNTRGSDFDTVLALYRGECLSSAELACSDDARGDRTSRIVLEDVEAGTYYLRIRGIGIIGAATYTIASTGVLADGEACDAQAPEYACPVGVCGGLPGAQRCGAPLDCRDLVDIDGDGTVDEDACIGPPAVTCPPNFDLALGDVVHLRGEAVDGQGLTSVGWSVAQSPEALFVPELADIGAMLDGQVPLAGDWTFRFAAGDADFNGVACETWAHVSPGPGLYVEAIWQQPGRGPVDLDLHLLDPAATAWLDPALDCFGHTCLDGLSWGTSGTAQDPRHLGDEYGTSGPEAVVVADPARESAPYRLGVHYAYDGATDMPVDVVLHVFCDGELAAVVGPVRLTNGVVLDPRNTFWLAADVAMGVTGCVVSPLMELGGGPVVVTIEEASMGR